MRWLLVCGCLIGCARDPVDAVCPEIDEGALVVTEVRGPQDDQDGPWIEMFNASGATIDLAGTKIRFRRKDGSSEIPVLVRRSLTVGAGEYTVLGLFFDADIPAHVDYGFLDDFEGSWLAAAAIDVETCGARVDLATYDALPAGGTYSLGVAPDADANNLPASWCTDVTVAGTPGAANNACP
ncbi:MAG: hypothetical protein H0V17_03675 [Deltaproteobacteria bacterium]|nr:hypothetical protein [Deltaproteobacteria bacterium]